MYPHNARIVAEFAVAIGTPVALPFLLYWIQGRLPAAPARPAAGFSLAGFAWFVGAVGFVVAVAIAGGGISLYWTAAIAGLTLLCSMLRGVRSAPLHRLSVAIAFAVALGVLSSKWNRREFPVSNNWRREENRQKVWAVAQAVKAYQDAKGHLPSSGPIGDQALPHSWRVHILPYLGRQDLYDAYNFSQPWNSPGNMALPMPYEYRTKPYSATGPRGQTNVVAVIGPDSYWSASNAAKRNLSPNRDGHVDLPLMLLEHKQSTIFWTEPRDIDAAAAAEVVNVPPKTFSRSNEDDFVWVAGGNGFPLALPRDLPPERIASLFTSEGYRQLPRSGWFRLRNRPRTYPFYPALLGCLLLLLEPSVRLLIMLNARVDDSQQASRARSSELYDRHRFNRV